METHGIKCIPVCKYMYTTWYQHYGAVFLNAFTLFYFFVLNFFLLKSQWQNYESLVNLQFVEVHGQLEMQIIPSP